MPRSARIVIPDLAHHITQRGNRKQDIFFSPDDYQAYVDILSIALQRHKTLCVAWCLMPNHIHLMLVPTHEDGLRAPLASAHTTYAQRINQNQKTSGHLFQGRFASYPMDDAHMMVAARYIENNPVKAKLVRHADEWPWSSARCHIAEQNDGLTDRTALSSHIQNWSAMLAKGLEAADECAGVEAAIVSGRPLASAAWLETHDLQHQSAKRGPPFRKNRESQLGTVPN